MIELGSLIQKPVLDVYSSCILGKVSDVYFDEYLKKAVYFCIAAESGSYTLLPFDEVQTFSDALVIADGVGFVSPHDVDVTALLRGVLNMPIYTLGGLDKGLVRSVSITSAGKVSRLGNGQEEFTPTAIHKIGDVILLKNTAKIKPKTRKIPRPKTETPVRILNEAIGANIAPSTNSTIADITDKSIIDMTSQNADIPVQIQIAQPQIADIPVHIAQSKITDIPVQLAQVQQPKPAIAFSPDNREPVLSDCALKTLIDDSCDIAFDDDTHTPHRVICDYEFLLGRTLGADLCTYTGELIASVGSIVNDYTVEQARRAGKLVELTLNSVKPTAQ